MRWMMFCLFVGQVSLEITCQVKVRLAYQEIRNFYIFKNTLKIKFLLFVFDKKRMRELFHNFKSKFHVPAIAAMY